MTPLPSSDFDLQHWSLVPQCGICGTRVVKDDQFVALSGTLDGSAFASCTEPMSFIAPSTVKAYKNSYLCRWAGCKTCVVAPDVVTLHADCLEVYEQAATKDNETAEKARQRLWIAASWRTPWKKAPFLSLFQNDNAQLSMSITLYKHLGISGMARMPPELASNIRELSKDSPLWRLNAAAYLALSLAEREKHEIAEPSKDDAAAHPTSIPLSKVEAWERGGQLVRREEKETTTATTDDSFIRLTVDTHGLLRIERLPERPAYDGTTSAGELAYALCEAKILDGADGAEGAKVHFQLGLGRLELPSGLVGLQIWDTPVPPPIKDVAYMRKHPKRVGPSSYLHVVDLDPEGNTVTGLTLLSNGGSLLGVHAHTAAKPSAAATAARLTVSTEDPLWQYMPLAPGDRIEAIGVRKDAYTPYLSSDAQGAMSLMFRKTLTGDTLLGYSLYDAPCETIMTAPLEKPRALVYSAVNSANGVVTDVGVYNVAASSHAAPAVRNGTRRHRFNHSAYPGDQLTEDAFQSNVPLAGVTHAQVFTYVSEDKDNDGLLRGIVLTYENGGQRALGMCCVAVEDNTKSIDEYARPVRLCFKSNVETGVTRLRVITEADLGTPAADGHGDDCEGGDNGVDEGYAVLRACCLMTGRLEFDVDRDRLVLEHFDNEEKPDNEYDEENEDDDVW
ncbi:hypothetical protein Sste5346_005574 [Sporothrix stenoceras]|uniref:Uncharacterized protein n=1 Tax=Sporothrix stenoceras TaxID=5173 RepID=A0ABR3Z3Q6_9PEZI